MTRSHQVSRRSGQLHQWCVHVVAERWPQWIGNDCGRESETLPATRGMPWPGWHLRSRARERRGSIRLLRSRRQRLLSCPARPCRWADGIRTGGRRATRVVLRDVVAQAWAGTRQYTPLRRDYAVPRRQRDPSDFARYRAVSGEVGWALRPRTTVHSAPAPHSDVRRELRGSRSRSHQHSVMRPTASSAPHSSSHHHEPALSRVIVASGDVSARPSETKTSFHSVSCVFSR